MPYYRHVTFLLYLYNTCSYLYNIPIVSTNGSEIEVAYKRQVVFPRSTHFKLVRPADITHVGSVACCEIILLHYLVFTKTEHLKPIHNNKLLLRIYLRCFYIIMSTLYNNIERNVCCYNDNIQVFCTTQCILKDLDIEKTHTGSRLWSPGTVNIHSDFLPYNLNIF